MNFTKYIWALVVPGMIGCTLLSPTTSNTAYNEDLSPQRPQVTLDTAEETPVEQEVVDVNPSNDQTEEVNQKITGITDHNATSRTAPGFTIQVYSGTSREEASLAKTQVYKILPNSRPETKYEQPIYRVRVGAFGDRLEAQNVYAQLLGEFPEAIVIPSRIRL